MKKLIHLTFGIALFLVSCGNSEFDTLKWSEVKVSTVESTLIPSIETKEVTATIKIEPTDAIDYLEISKVGADPYTDRIEGHKLTSPFRYTYQLTENDPEQFTLAVVAYSKDGSRTHPLFLKIDNRKGMFINSVTRIARVTGTPMSGETFPSPNKTSSRWNVGGTDLGIIWEMSPGKYGLFFGDTFGADFKPNPTAPGPNGTSWRSNVLAFSEDTQLDDGLTISSMAADRNGKAREIVYGGKDGSGFGDWTSIPTAAIRANGTDYVHYMNIKNWAGWITNYSSLYKSNDNGQTWRRCTSVRFSENSNFGQAAYFKKDGYVYMVGTQTGRNHAAYLARFKETDIETQAAYEYWNGKTKQWVRGDEGSATVLIPGTVGEASLIYNESFKKWIIAYFNEALYNITLRSADNITGPWTEPIELASGRDYAQLYGSFFHPLSSKGRNLYFTMSMWLPYNTFLMKVELGGMGN